MSDEFMLTKNDSEQNERLRGLEVKVDGHDRQLTRLWDVTDGLVRSTSSLESAVHVQSKWFWGVNIILFLAIAAGVLKIFIGG